MGQGESRLRRWFGKEHNPKRAALVRQTIRYQGTGDGLFVLGAWLFVDVHILLGIPVMALGIWIFGLSIKKAVEAFREPHWGSPAPGTTARPT
jgi:hypothetical protein